ncbi:TPA: hypothetical protein ROX98_003518 [Bacillus pseudomycoides]|nr:hypothetical protein [Bacillus pseudomycoides]
MQSLKSLKWDIIIFLPLFIYNAVVLVSMIVIENEFGWVRLLITLACLYVWVSSAIDIRNMKYKIK